MSKNTDDQPQASAPDLSAAVAELRVANRLLAGILIILTMGVVFFARDMFLPIMIGILITLTVSPMVRAATRAGIPAPVASGVLIVGLGVLGLAASYALSGPITTMIEDAPEMWQQVRGRLGFVFQSLNAVQDVGREVEDLATSGREQTVSLQQPGLIAGAVSSLANVLLLIAVGLVLAFFLLASGDLFYEKLVDAIPTFGDQRRAVQTMRDIERRISHYFLTITVINAGLGVAVAAAMMMLSLPNPALWGLLAFCLNFLPFIGALMGGALIGIYALVIFESLSGALIVPFVYLMLTTIEGQFLTPTLLGRRLELNTVAVVLAVIIWSWLWGIPGALMAVPFLVLIKVIAENVRAWQSFANFLGSSARLS